MFQHTAARRRLPHHGRVGFVIGVVSTHSRPKAAARDTLIHLRFQRSFNTQPPEGGCMSAFSMFSELTMFQHTAARRRLRQQHSAFVLIKAVSTHSRPKAAARTRRTTLRKMSMFQHTAARRRLRIWLGRSCQGLVVSTHSRPKAAACVTSSDQSCTSCFNTQPPEGGCGKSCAVGRAKHGFNTQPPEGGCDGYMQTRTDRFLFQHTAARRRLLRRAQPKRPPPLFQHTAARRRLLTRHNPPAKH